jgi:hypothetical protein
MKLTREHCSSDTLSTTNPTRQCYCCIMFQLHFFHQIDTEMGHVAWETCSNFTWKAWRERTVCLWIQWTRTRGQATMGGPIACGMGGSEQLSTAKYNWINPQSKFLLQAGSRYSGGESPRLLRDPNVHDCVHKSVPFDCVLNLLKPSGNFRYQQV